MEYLGCIKKSDFDKLNNKEKDTFLLKNGFFSNQELISLDHGVEHFMNNELVSSKMQFIAVPELIDDFYDFLLARYDRLIIPLYSNLMTDLNDDIYGLEYKEQKKIALNYFNDSYGLFDMYQFHGLNTDLSNDIINISQVERFGMIYLNRLNRKNRISTRKFIIEFLVGNVKYFNEKLYLEDDLILEFVALEANILFLQNVNNIFNFEIDRYFSQYAKLSELYENYTHIFNSVNVFIKVYETIKELKVKIPVNIVSLYETLIELDLIIDNKTDFKAYLLNVHNIELANIPKKDDEDDFTPHKKRVKKMIKDFQDLTSTN